jgi:hypothetical protein
MAFTNFLRRTLWFSGSVCALAILAAVAWQSTRPPKSEARSSDDTAPQPPEGDRPIGEAKPQGVVVVELFTSEGCSSCPPADRLLSELSGKEPSRRPVYTLAFHVDYWDQLGWKDPFSDPYCTRRQRAYARLFQADNVYTPQLIVNGRREFLGSDRKQALAAIDEALLEPAQARIELSIERSEKGICQAAFTVTGAPAGAVLNLACVESGLSSHVDAGENEGRILEHDHVVRAFQTVLLAEPRGTVRLNVPRTSQVSRSSVVAYVQLPDSGRIVGAAARSLVDN